MSDSVMMSSIIYFYPLIEIWLIKCGPLTHLCLDTKSLGHALIFNKCLENKLKLIFVDHQPGRNKISVLTPRLLDLADE